MRTNNLNLPDEKKLIVDTLLKKIEKKYKNDISLVVCYGSYITGATYQSSDIDFYFIPKTDKGYEMNSQFIIENIGYDFWPVSWERAERIANFEEPLTSIIADGAVIYYGDTNDRSRFDLLKQKIIASTNPEDKALLLNRSEKTLIEAKALFYDMDKKGNDYEAVSSHCVKIMGLLLNVMALINSTYIKKAVYNIEHEIKTYSYLPQGYLELFQLAIRSRTPKEIRNAVKNMISDVDVLVQKIKAGIDDGEVPNDTFKGFYEELKSAYNKLIHSCNTKDYVTAFFTAHLIDSEIKSILGERYKEYNYPNLLIITDGEAYYDRLIECANQHEAALVHMLKTLKIDISSYVSIDEFVISLENQKND